MPMTRAQAAATAPSDDDIVADQEKIIKDLRSQVDGGIMTALTELPFPTAKSYLEQLASLANNGTAVAVTQQGAQTLASGQSIFALSAPASAPALVAGPVASGSVSDDDQQIIDNVKRIAAALKVDPVKLIVDYEKLLQGILSDPATSSAKMAGVAMVADGTTPVNSDGSADHSEALEPVKTELQNERDDHTATKAELADTKTKLTTTETELTATKGQLTTAEAAKTAAEANEATANAAKTAAETAKSTAEANELAATNALAPVTAERDRLNGIVAEAMIDLKDLVRAVNGDGRLKARLNKVNPGFRPEFRTALNL